MIGVEGDEGSVERRPSGERAVWTLAAALSSAVTSADVATALAENGASAVDAVFSNLALADPATKLIHATHGSMLNGAVTSRWNQFPLDTATPLGSAIIDGYPVLLGNLDQIRARYPALEADTIRAGLTAIAAFTLRSVTGTAIGAIGFGWDEGQTFDDEQVRRLLLVADVTGQTLDRALLYEQARKQLAAVDRAQAAIMQHAFLPTPLADTPGLEVAAAYLPAGAPLGGDWYDAFAVEGGTCLVIGDVAGHGLEGLAVMALLRNAIRAFASLDPTPSLVLTRANRLLCRMEPEATATCIVAVWNPDDQTLLRANAGHPPPLRCRRGEFDYVTPPGDHLLLGAVGEHEFTDQKTFLRVGTTFLFYTDGLIEDRTSTLDEGMAALRDFVESLGDQSPASLCREVVQWRSGRTEREDDMCIVAVRVADQEP